MKRIKKEMLGTYIGAVIGLVAFFAIGLLPGMLYGGYAGLALGAVLFGVPVEPTITIKVLTFGGMALGIVAAFSLFVVLGSFFGAAAGSLVMSVARRAAGAAGPADDAAHALERR